MLRIILKEEIFMYLWFKCILYPANVGYIYLIVYPTNLQFTITVKHQDISVLIPDNSRHNETILFEQACKL